VAGTFGVPTGNGFTVTGNNLAGPIQPGESYQGLFFTTQTNVTGPHSETLVFHPTDVNDSGFNNELSDITLTVTDTVAPPAQAELNSPDRIIFPNVRVGTPEDQPVSITNGAGEGARSLDVSPVATPAATVTGSISMLAPGATDYTDIRVGLDTSQAGARSGYVTLDAASDGGNGDTMPVLPEQFIDVFGSVYRLAAAAITTTSLVVHVGDPGTTTLTVKNTDPADGYSENLIATLASTSGNLGVTGGTTGEIAPNTSDSQT